MSYSNTFTTIVTTVLKRYGLQLISFNEDNTFSIFDYSSTKEKKFPINEKLTNEELDDIVKNLNECPIVCECDDAIPNEDNC